ncbi:alginate lyase family protein [Hufsiella ginkgonis]|uniref:Alginate lyase domain-containing protein n=1 Tax=Hufsiella ginkgonis TaxID=2695274 RepID=A0A7K1XY60_9SPHI|nr:alginate lyase family protein [Hufsiella ginkgonis]MXV15777.1 hypothetical protein [Hufsiella ginkgonis]
MKRQVKKSLVLAFSMVVAGVLVTNCTKKSTLAEEPGSSGQWAEKSGKAVVAADVFKHPGVLNTKESLDIIGNEVDASPTGARGIAYNQVKSYVDNVQPSNAYVAVVTVAGGSSPQSETNFKKDAILSYALALRWAKTGDAQYATKAKNILNGWAYAFQSFAVTGGESRQAALEASWAAPNFTAAAEILRRYTCRNGATSGWSSTDINKFTSFLNNLNQNYIDKVVNTYHMTNNWAVSAGYAKMAIGVFEESLNLYNTGLGIIKERLPNLIQADGSMPGETCSHDDFVHFQYSLTGFSYAANIAAIQNDASVYSDGSSRLRTGYIYLDKIIRHAVTDPCGVTWDNSQIQPGIDIANRRYNTVETNRIQAMGDPHGPTGDNCFLGFTTYTHHQVFP